MIIKLISGILVLICTICFIGFNIDKTCDVSVIFYTFKNVPIFFTILISFVLGVLVTIPIMIVNFSKSKKSKTVKETKTNSEKVENLNSEAEKNENSVEEAKTEKKSENL